MFKLFNFMQKRKKEVLEVPLKKQLDRTKITKILVTLIILTLLFIFLLVGVSFYKYFKSPEKQLGLGANIESALLGEDEQTAYIKLAGGSEENITKIKFIFTDSEGNERFYETNEGREEISVSLKRGFWDWLFGRQFYGEYDYAINVTDLSLDNFNNIEKVGVVFAYKTETGEELETEILDTKEPTTTISPSTGGGGGGPPGVGGNGRDSGDSGDGGCTPDKDCFYYYNLDECGSLLSDGCEDVLDCNICPDGKICQVGSCVEITKNYTNNISQFGITWYFDKPYQYGQFANGDYWVVGLITVIDITKPSNMSERDGSMINPTPSTQHGYDGRVGGYIQNLDVSNFLPNLIVNPNESLISTISRNPTETERSLRRPALEVASVLTVLDKAPLEGSFRPPYAGSDKPIYSSKNLNANLLLRLEPVASTPPLSVVEGLFNHAWMDHVLEWQGDDLHPKQNLNNYGAGIARDSGIGALRLLLNNSLEDKELLLIRYVQLGIDNYGLVKNGANWGNVGGTIGVGRKIPILFAGLMLDNSEIKNIASSYDTRHVFEEDAQTFYLTQAERDATYHSDNCAGSLDYCHPGYYDSTPLGTPVWGERHYKWLSTGYNYLPGKLSYLKTTHKSTIGAALIVHLLGIEELWNHDPFLDWTDCSRNEGVNGTWGSIFADDMWDTYRNQFGCVWTRNNKTSYYSQGHYSCSGCQHNCLISPYCGDDVCNGNETFESCGWDCVETSTLALSPVTKIRNFLKGFLTRKTGNIIMFEDN